MYAKVIVGLNHPATDQLFDYEVPEKMQICQGVRVIVPFGRRNAKKEGYVISLCEKTDIPADKIKKILAVMDEGKPTFTAELLDLASWMQRRYVCTLNQCLQAMIPAGIRTKSSWSVQVMQFEETVLLTPKESKILEFIGERKEVPLEDLQEEFGTKIMDFLRKMQEKGLLELNQQIAFRAYHKEKRFLCLVAEHPQKKEILEKAKKDKRMEGQRKILQYLQEGEETTAEQLKKVCQVTDAPIKTLLKKGILKERKETTLRNVIDENGIEKTEPFLPTSEQAAALTAIGEERKRKNKRPILLHGVTGSGKTEIYMQVIADVLAEGKQAIVLVPEIALTPLMQERFFSRFGDVVSVTHSRLSMGERVDQWKKARDGKISVIIGPRSALFLPFQNVGVIVMDEAHENSYISDITPKYATREVAEEVAKKYQALFLMGTATPDLASYQKAKDGIYLYLELKERTAGGGLPQVAVVDLRKELAEGNRSVFSRALQMAIRENLQKGEQTMLFLNRRGYATFVSCRNCGEVLQCPSCDIAYTYHAKTHTLLCHYCGKQANVPQNCPKCNSKYIRYFGTGTQKIEEEAKKLFPQARILRMDLDTTKKKHSYAQIIETFGKGEADILIGTQMIAKGHDFPQVTLVGIMAADVSLHLNHYMAAEEAFRLMVQAAGRCGRRNAGGRVYIQTYQPEHYAVRYAAKQDYDGFSKTELLMRQTMGYPPFSTVFAILITAEKKETAAEAADDMAEELKKANQDGAVDILGPVPASLPKFRGIYRYQILVRATQEELLYARILPVLEKVKKDRKNMAKFQLLLHPCILVNDVTPKSQK